MQPVAEHAEKAGIILALESLNRFETYLLNTIADAVKFARDVNHPNCQMDKFSVSESLVKLKQYQETFNESPPPHQACFLTLFQHGTLGVEIYRPEKVDLQTPHDQDELYCIASGSGWFETRGLRRQVEPGDILFVPAGDEHRFVDFSDDFSTWVFLYGPAGGEKPGNG